MNLFGGLFFPKEYRKVVEVSNHIIVAASGDQGDVEIFIEWLKVRVTIYKMIAPDIRTCVCLDKYICFECVKFFPSLVSTTFLRRMGQVL